MAVPYHSLLKIPFLLLGTLCVQVSLSSPNPSARKKDQQTFAESSRPKHGGLLRLGDLLPRITKFYKSLVLVINVVEVFWILMSCSSIPRCLPTHFIPAATFKPPLFTELDIRITPIFLAGFALIVSGTVLRIVCYRQLGQFFTFELTLKPNHQLVTSGPYSIVRHPSYTGGLGFMTGLLMTQMGSGSWWSESKLWEIMLGKMFVGVWVLTIAIVEGFLVYRTGKEDEALRARFGETWVAWEKQTRYSLVPYIY